MNDDNTKNREQLRRIAAQLRCPSGTEGLEMADLMNRTNINMTLNAIMALGLQNNDSLLELGHGNCGHLDKIKTQAAGIQYHGLETSELMVEEAKKINRSRVVRPASAFKHYDGTNIPYPDAFFDKVLTVNTLYFWKNPLALLQEIYRVLKPNGLFSIAFADKHFMSGLPFTEYGFSLYAGDDFKSLIHKTDFNLLSMDTKKEMVQHKMDGFVEREYYVGLCKK